MWSWLSKIDPNVVIPFALAAGGYLWRKIRGDKTEAWSKVIVAILGTFAHELLDVYDNINIASRENLTVAEFLKRSRVYINERAWQVLAKRGVPRNKTTEKLLHSAIEETTEWLGDEIRKSRSKGKT